MHLNDFEAGYGYSFGQLGADRVYWVWKEKKYTSNFE